MTPQERAEIEAILDGGLIPLSDYIKAAWHVVEPATKYIHNWHIDAIAEHLEAVTRGQIRRLIINIPPRHQKSLSVSVFWPTWVWTWQPEKRWLFASYAGNLATRDSLACRRIIESQWYQSRWGHVFKLAGDQNQKMRFENNKTGYRLATGVGGVATGEGGDVVVVDDPHKVQEIESARVREAALEWWDKTMSTRLNNPNTGAQVIIMQRVHEQDLTGHVLEQGGYEHLCLPAEYEGHKYITCLGNPDPRQEIGELLWPDRFSKDAISELKMRLGSYAAAGQLQQRPAPAEGGIFKKAWWSFWQRPGDNYKPVTVRLPDGEIHECPLVTLPDMERKIQSWDMAFKAGPSSDFVVGQVWGVEQSNYYLLDQVRARLDMPGTIKALLALAQKYPDAVEKLVEDKANGPAIIQTLRQKVPGLKAYNPRGDKVARAQAVVPVIESGNVFLPHPSVAPWVDALIDRFAAFPNIDFDDEIDTATQALDRLVLRVGARYFGSV